MGDIFKDASGPESVIIQLEEWLKGNSVHNTVRDECCPDFSCCGSPIAPEPVRVRFAKAHLEGDQEVMMAILGMSLSGLETEVQGTPTTQQGAVETLQ